MDYSNLTLCEIKNGYRFDKETNVYKCNYCGDIFREGQIYPSGKNLLVAERAIDDHIVTGHGGNFEQLINSDTKYNALTENQKELLSFFYANVPDNEIANKLGVSASTVRRQKFAFREKAKQAKLFLAAFELAFESAPKNDESIVPIHNNAKYYDDRYVITEKEKEHILQTSFESLDPLKLKTFSSKEKKKVVILAKIAELFESGKNYSEKEVNQILKPVYEDYALIRRYLIMYGFMDREGDGSRYWIVN